MRTLGVDDVVVPVRLEDLAVGVEVALVGGEAVGAIENGKKIGQQIDQHSTGRGRAALQAIWTRNDSGDGKCEQERDRHRMWHSFSLCSRCTRLEELERHR